MQKCLYLLCPTDCLESVINQTYRNENYFYSSLGNGFMVEHTTMEYIKKTIRKYEIQEISFVLSTSNHIVKDALGAQDFLKFRGLSTLYGQLIKQKTYSELFWQTAYSELSLLSYYLNAKIKELQLELGAIRNFPLKINGKIYDRDAHVFKKIYAELVCIEKQCLN